MGTFKCKKHDTNSNISWKIFYPGCKNLYSSNSSGSSSGAYLPACTICYQGLFQEETTNENTSTEPFITFPFSDINSSVYGELFNNAIFDTDKIRLTEAAEALNGEVGYQHINLRNFTAEFTFKHVAVEPYVPADSVYFYFKCNEIPAEEHGTSSESDGYVDGYIVGFSEYYHQISIYYGNTSVASSFDQIFDFLNDTWYTARIVFNIHDQEFWIYIDDVLKWNVVDSTPRDLTGKKLGIGGRTGAAWAEHYVKNFTIDTSLSPP